MIAHHSRARIFARSVIDNGTNPDAINLARAYLESRTPPTPRPKTRPRPMPDHRTRQLIRAGAELFLCTEENVLDGDRHAHAAACRHAIAWVMRTAWGLSFPVIGHLLGRDHTTIMSACARIERAVLEGSELGRRALELRATVTIPGRLSPGLSRVAGGGTILEGDDEPLLMEVG